MLVCTVSDRALTARTSYRLIQLPCATSSGAHTASQIASQIAIQRLSEKYEYIVQETQVNPPVSMLYLKFTGREAPNLDGMNVFCMIDPDGPED